jgi:hypothetical protein
MFLLFMFKGLYEPLTNLLSGGDGARAAEMPAADCAFWNKSYLGHRLIIVWDRLTGSSDFRTVDCFDRPRLKRFTSSPFAVHGCSSAPIVLVLESSQWSGVDFADNKPSLTPVHFFDSTSLFEDEDDDEDEHD